MKKKIIICLVIFIIIFISCANFNTYQYKVTPEIIGIKNDTTIIVWALYSLFERVPGGLDILDNQKESYWYLVEKNINEDTFTIKGEKNISAGCGIITHNNIIGLGSSVVQFFNANYYQIIKSSTNMSISNFHDFTSDLNRFLFNNMGLYEHNMVTTTTVQILPYYVKDAKYCPINENSLAYVRNTITAENMTGDLYTMNNDGTNIVPILSGYNISKIYWHPNGDIIVFLNDTGVWRINKDGSGLIKIIDFILPAECKSVALYYSLVAYIDKDRNVKVVRF